MDIHWGTTASARPPRQTRTHIQQGRLPERYHSAPLHPVRFCERTHASSSVLLRSSAMSGRRPCKAVVDALPLRFWVNRQINHLAFRSYLPGDPSQRRPFVFAPKSEIQDDVGMKLESTQSYPEQTTFQDIPCCRIVSSK